MEDIELRRLVIKAFHMNDVEFGDENKITTDGKMTITKDGLDALAAKHSEVIEKIDIQIIKPGDHDRYTNTIMDIIPISVKVLGKCGEGITHTITGVYVMPTGVDVDGEQAHEFGSSNGNLKDMLYHGRGVDERLQGTAQEVRGHKVHRKTRVLRPHQTGTEEGPRHQGDDRSRSDARHMDLP